MISLISPSKAQREIAQNLRSQRLQQNLTQEGLSLRSGVPLATLRRFERQGMISLESLLKLMMVLGMLSDVVQATGMKKREFSSLDEVLKADRKPERKRGRKT